MARRLIEITGIVQGVGFRPYVYGLARRLGLGGSVRNETGGVRIEVEGEPAALDSFQTELTARPPPAARIASVSWQPTPPRGEKTFCIDASTEDEAGPVFVAPDLATCAACLAELFDPADRRYRYPFLNCTDCGPRLTIVRAVPYDRPRTTMAGFAMCPACRAEYDDPADRRFHAQPTACPTCGPRLHLLDAHGAPIDGDPLTHAVAALRGGAILAVKGLGGYHLACRADDAQAVGELRRRKQRDEKPFAVMVPDVAAAEQLCVVEADERELLLTPRRPIVLLPRLANAAVAEGVAPGNPHLGVMLPYTPLHHLLLHDLGGAPLVMTSGNRSDEPIAYEDRDALDRLHGIAELFLTHDRPIHLRCDDSVTRIVAGAALPLRRARGHAPEPLPLPFACARPVLAVGGQLKAVFALARGRHAFLSHHLGDLDHYQANRAYVEAVRHYQGLFDLTPEAVVHDLHPEYVSTRYAVEWAAARGLRRLAVQHHHAHMASCMAEHGLEGDVIGVSLDGTGYGTDGAIWGGEFLVGGYRAYRRAAHLRYVALPGGDQAVREPWRVALAHLADAGLEYEALRKRIAPSVLHVVGQMLRRRINAPLTSSAGRLFDAVASLAGVRDRVSYEGQAAMELEWAASGVAPDGCYPFALAEPATAAEALQIDTRPLIAAVVKDVCRGTTPGRIGRRFHSTLVEVIARVCARLREAAGLQVVVLSGGVFMNALLLREAVARLTADGFRACRHQRVPPNDGGLCLGQLAVAAYALQEGEDDVSGDSR